MLADAAQNLGAARAQMAISLGWHIILACLGVGFPLLIGIAEYLSIRRGDASLNKLARRWARTSGVLFAVGAVSGTILSFEMGILWPGLMNTFGSVFGFPFALEGIAFFIEAIFIGIYLYGWERLTPMAHFVTVIPVCIAGAASAFFVVTANAWMNQPQGFVLTQNGTITNTDPWTAMLNPATPVETIHMILAAYMVSGFLVASYYALLWLRGHREAYHRTAFLIAFTVAAVCTGPQIIVGDMAARYVAEHQPAKLAAMEALYRTTAGAPEHLGGIVIDGKLTGAVEIPHALSFFISGDVNSTVRGLDSFPPDQRPDVNVVHIAFDIMVGIGTGLLGLALWTAALGMRRRRLPQTRWYWRFCALAGIGAVVAMECGWIVTEVGRQPWIVYGVMRTADAVNPAPALWTGLIVLIGVYTVLTVAVVATLRRMHRSAGEN